MNKNKLTFIIIILVIVGILIAAIFWRQKNNTSALNDNKATNVISEIDNNFSNGWKTYKNTDFGYEIKYPYSWLAFDSSNNITYALQEYNITPKYDQEKFFGAPNLLQIIVFRENIDSYLKSHNSFNDKENFILNGYNANKLIFTNSKYPIQYAMEHNGKVFVINVQVATNYDTGITEDDANRVISTFRFVDEESNEKAQASFYIDQKIAIISSPEPLPTDNWKVYKNNKYGYEVKYPNEWFIYERELYPKEKESGYPEEVYFSTTQTTDSPNNRITPWARVVFGVFKKSKEESLEQWLAKIGAIPAPGVDIILQYVQLGDKKFLGTIDFDKIGGWKNAYFEISEDKVLKLSLMLQVEDLNYSKIFYSMINNLRIK